MFAAKPVNRLSVTLGETLMRGVGGGPAKVPPVKLLLIEDNPEMQTTLQRSFERRGMQVVICGDGARALDRWQASVPDVVVLDLSLPGLDGLEVLTRARAAGLATPVLVLTARGTVGDRVLGLNAGADDYLGKPFAFEELVARVNALGRRSQPPLPPVLRASGLEVDVPRHQASRDGTFLRLSKKEFGVLAHLVANAGRVVSAEELLEKVWDENADPFTNSVRMTLVTLRRKLGDPPVVETITGVGYRIQP